uniref:Histidine phosphatase family protein n=1 Tax=Thermodesulfobacterium geofontis TaxID=1295609 RepID=A0A7V6CDM8_9BACT
MSLIGNLGRNFFFLRHGFIAEEYRKVFYGQFDVPLSEEGKIKSLKVVDELSNYSIKAIFSSPLKRALFPAKALSERKNIPLIIKEELKEINYGAWTGRPREEIYKEPLFWERLKNDTYFPPGGESIRDLRKRAKNFWDSLKDLEEGLYVIFTHGGFIKALLCELLNLGSRFFLTFEVYHLRGVLITCLGEDQFFIRGVNLDIKDLGILLESAYW